ncbi:MAG: asparagine synthase (glutamine-hydrolyzing) [Pseudomonadota bacterium]
MCGIAGIFDLKGERNVDRRALQRMTDALAHRGPDGEGFFTAPGISFGHRRLAIIDIEGGDQPFHSASGNSTIIFNGEIYNFQGLAKELTARGAALRTRSDTEVLVEGLDRMGAEFVSDLRAMFAFAWWNAHTKTLTLARDRLGERPLYYAETKDGFLLFASEITAIAASGLIELGHCPRAMMDYFHFGYVPDPKSIYRGVKKLPPGSMITVRRGHDPALSRYWAPAFTTGQPDDFDGAGEELLQILDEAVRLQMISDVPLGAFLSGGVDSSAVVASMAQHANAIMSCAIGFNEASHDERRFARAVAAQYKTDHREEVTTIDAAQDIPAVAAAFGEPFADASALPTFAVCRLARRHVTVALSGDGGDEVFAGYRRYPFFLAEERARSLAPAGIRKRTLGALGDAYPKLDWAPRPLRFKTTLQALGETRAGAYFRATAINLPEHVRGFLTPDFIDSLEGYDPITVIEDAAAEAPDDPLLWAQHVDLATWLPGRMLTKVDRTSMANSLEVRPPLLDHKLVEWANGLSPASKLGPGPDHKTTGKRILKAATRARLDEEILYRPKQGFGLPIRQWLEPGGALFNDFLVSSHWRQSGIVTEAAVDQMAAAQKTGRRDFSQELWTLMMFDAFLAQTPQRPVKPSAT